MIFPAFAARLDIDLPPSHADTCSLQVWPVWLLLIRVLFAVCEGPEKAGSVAQHVRCSEALDSVAVAVCMRRSVATLLGAQEDG